MNKIKKLFIFILVFVCAFSLFGCNKKSRNTLYVISSWEQVAMKNHINGGASTGIMEWYCIEPLVQYVRSTDEVFYILAKNIVHNDDRTTLIYLREESKWHNGSDYTAKDVIAYYYLNQQEVTNYMQSIEEVDAKTVKITWKESLEPADEVKTLLLSIDPVGCVCYEEFKEYVDFVKVRMDAAEDMPEGYTGWAPFGKIVSAETSDEFSDNYANVASFNPDWYIGTGPFKLYNSTKTDMILVKDPDHWMADYIPYDYIHAYNGISDPTQIYGMLESNKLDYSGGIMDKSTADTILNMNKNLVNLKCYDPGNCGLLFNLTKTVEVNGVEEQLFNDEVREAFCYIFDRDEIAYVANPFATTVWTSMLGMCKSEAQRYMSEEAYNAIKKYSYNQEIAKEKLIAAGWSFKDGTWYGKDGNKVSFTLHYDGSNDHQNRAAQACGAQLNAFGIETKLKSSSTWSDWFGTAQSTVWAAELSLNWTDLNMSISYPSGSYVYAFKDVTWKVIHLNTYPDKGEEGYLDYDEKDWGTISEVLPAYHTEIAATYRLKDYKEGLYSLTATELQNRVDDLCYGVSTKNWGIPFYQNTCCIFLNTEVFTDLPTYTERNDGYVPFYGDEGFYEHGRLNNAFSKIAFVINWNEYLEDHPEEKITK